MNKFYYAVPINSKHTYLNGIKLSNMLKIAYPEIYEIEELRDKVYEKFDFEADEYRSINSKRNKLYGLRYIPEYILVEERDGSYHEVLTNGVITTDKLSEFETHDIPNSFAYEYYEHENYPKKFLVFYEEYIYERNNSIKNDIKYNTKTLKKEK